MNRMLPILMAGLLTGCSNLPELPMPDVSDWFSRENAVDVSELRRALVCNSESSSAQVTLLPDLAAARAFESARGITLLGDEPLPPGPYALVEHGSRNSGGYGVAVSRTAGRRGDVLILKATFIAPAPNRMVAQMLTSPCVLVGLPAAQYGAVELIDQSGKLRASTEPS